MKFSSQSLRACTILIVAGLIGEARGQEANAPIGADRIIPVPMKSVQLNDAFWSPRLEVIRTVSIPAALAKCEETGRIANFETAAAVLRGDANVEKKLPANPFDDADVFKLIEAASYTLAWHPDAKLEEQLDELIVKIAAAQEKDGYLYTARTINPESPHALAGEERWINEKAVAPDADSFELSNLGYLYKAAVAHFEATGKRSLLEVAIRSADLLASTFGSGKRSIWPGHEGVEIGLIRLSAATGKKQYVDLAKFFLDERGPSADAAGQTGRGRRGGRGNTNQSQAKVAEQSTASGNAVDGAHLYAAMAEVAAVSGATAYRDAVDKIWEDVVGHKLYITGGIGVTTTDGAFGRNYALPNMTAASTTAASAANVEWNQRMFQLHGDGKYVDVLERTLYNALLAGISLDGKSYFDANVLESLGRQQRREWPPTGGRRGNANVNQAVLASSPIGALSAIAAMPGYIYATRGDEIFVNLFVNSTADISLPSGRKVKIVQETKYPWDGLVKLTVTPDRPASLVIHVRRPDWANSQSEEKLLYSYSARPQNGFSIQYQSSSPNIMGKYEDGYARSEAVWSGGDVMVVSIPMRVEQVKPHELVVDDVGRQALQKGPIVYCLEATGNEPANVRSLVLPSESPLYAELTENLLDGIGTLKGQAFAVTLDKDDKLSHTEQPFTAVPYYAWANRGAGEMLVWIPNVDSQAVPIAEPNLASKARISASAKKSGDSLDRYAPSAKDGIESRSSHDNSPLSHFDWWPDRSVTVTCEYTWDQPITIKQTQAYWWDDSTTGGGCKVPASWTALYKKGDEWVPVETNDSYGVAADQYNKVNFTPVETTALRLEIKIRDDASVGIQEWKVW